MKVTIYANKDQTKRVPKDEAYWVIEAEYDLHGRRIRETHAKVGVPEPVKEGSFSMLEGWITTDDGVHLLIGDDGQVVPPDSDKGSKEPEEPKATKHGNITITKGIPMDKHDEVAKSAKEFISQIPPKYMKEVTEVRVSTQKEMEIAIGYPSEGLAGYYSRNENLIALGINTFDGTHEEKLDALYVLRHEVGHNVFENQISQPYKEIWYATAYQMGDYARKSGDNLGISGHGMISGVHEIWAEAFSDVLKEYAEDPEQTQTPTAIKEVAKMFTGVRTKYSDLDTILPKGAVSPETRVKLERMFNQVNNKQNQMVEGWVTLDDGRRVWIGKDANYIDITNKSSKGIPIETQHKMRDELRKCSPKDVKTIKEILIVDNSHWDDDEDLINVRKEPFHSDAYVAGEWKQDEDWLHGTIYINGDKLDEVLESGTIIHEVGHQALFNISNKIEYMKSTNDDNWNKVWEEERHAHMMDWGWASMTSPGEAFANLYADFHQGKPIPEKVAGFFDRHGVKKNEN